MTVTGYGVQKALILPNDLYEKEIRRDMPQSVIEAVSFNDALYGYPSTLETSVLVYNKALILFIPP